MVEIVEEDNVIRFGVEPAGKYVTWYSIEADPHSHGVAVNVINFPGSVITFWLIPLTSYKSKLTLQTAIRVRARKTSISQL